MPESVQHAVAVTCTVNALDTQERLAFERGEQVGDVPAGDAIAAANLFGSLGRPRAGKHRHAAEEQALGLRQKPEAPGHCRFQRPLADHRCARAHRPESVRQPPQELLRREGRHLCGGKLNRERDAVKAPADGRNRAHVVRFQDEGGLHSARALQEQRARCEAREGAGLRSHGARWHGKRRHAIDRFPGDPERFAACRHDAQSGGCAEQCLGQLGAAVDEVFARVEQQEHCSLTQVADYPVAQRSLRALTDLAATRRSPGESVPRW